LPQWEKQVRDYILSCETCQKIKAPAVSRNAPLQPILPSKPMEIVTTDCMGPVPTSNNRNKHALIIIDHFTKWVEIHAIRDTQAKTVAKCLIKFICRHGIPDQLHSDQGTSYRNELLDHITELLDIHKTQTAAYHPQCDGISERFMRPLKAMISSKIDEHQKDWDHNLDQFAFAYNTSTHASTQDSPFFLM
jgi:transposase InsO family protein